MIPLDSKRWSELQHAYGSAGDIPDLLRRLRTAPGPTHYQEDPWFSLWSALCHQGDVHTATYAALPYMIEYAEERPLKERLEFLHFIGWAEACRSQAGQPAIPKDLEPSYSEALGRSTELFLSALQEGQWNENELCTLLGGIAAVRGYQQLGRLLMNGLDRCTVCGEYSAVEPICEHMREVRE